MRTSRLYDLNDRLLLDRWAQQIRGFPGSFADQALRARRACGISAPQRDAVD
ncbi:MAG: hypothetical protein ACJ8R9_05165 [Steroidobacteraceae bacterium]